MRKCTGRPESRKKKSQLTFSLKPAFRPVVATDTFALPARAAVRKPGRHGEPAADDERAGRGHEGAGGVARRDVSRHLFLPLPFGRHDGFLPFPLSERPVREISVDSLEKVVVWCFLSWLPTSPFSACMLDG